jgi:hypothetical protein
MLPVFACEDATNLDHKQRLCGKFKYARRTHTTSNLAFVQSALSTKTTCMIKHINTPQRKKIEMRAKASCFIAALKARFLPDGEETLYQPRTLTLFVFSFNLETAAR